MMGKATGKEKKTRIEVVPALVLAKDNEVKGKMIPAGTVIFVGECAEGIQVTDIDKAIARGNVKAVETEIEVEDSDEKAKKDKEANDVQSSNAG